MVSTFVGPGAIFLILAGSFNTVFKMDIWDAIIANGIPVILFMLACYFLDQKIQLSFAKLLTIGYILLMLAVMIGIFIQVSNSFCGGGAQSPRKQLKKCYLFLFHFNNYRSLKMILGCLRLQ